MTKQLPHLDLDAMRSDAGTITVDGTTHVVRQITGSGFRNMQQLAKARTDSTVPVLDLLYDTVHKCVPTVPREQIDDLSPQKCGAILAMATGNVAAVEEFAKAVMDAQSKEKPQEPKTEGGIILLDGPSNEGNGSSGDAG